MKTETYHTSRWWPDDVPWLRFVLSGVGAVNTTLSIRLHGQGDTVAYICAATRTGGGIVSQTTINLNRSNVIALRDACNEIIAETEPLDESST